MKTNHLVIILVVISALIFTALFVGYGRNATDGSDTGDASGTPTVTPEDISRTSESEEITSPPEESTAVETEALTEEEITTEITQPEETETAEVTAEVETTEIPEATEAVETTVIPETIAEETVVEEVTETIPPVEETTEVIPEETTTEFKEPTVEPAVTETEVTIPIPPEKEYPKEEETTTKAENEYKPPETGDNPFAGGGKTEVKDNPSDDYIGEGEDRPGEGIHF